MFTGGAMVTSDMTEQDWQNVAALLESFSQRLRGECLGDGLGVQHVPFARPVNFIVTLVPNSLLLVVDDSPVGGMPAQTFFDRRGLTPTPTLRDVLSESQRELGFRKPRGLRLPIELLGQDEATRQATLTPIIDNLRADFVQEVKLKQLNFPPGYEHFARYFPDFIRDHPDIHRNVFLMMRFKEGKQYQDIHKTLKSTLKPYCLDVLRSDDKDYTGDLWDNVCLYMLACEYGIAVFEEIDERQFNPSVALELGFMRALDKRCLILKDKRMPSIPTDIIGKLYKPFDTYKISESLNDAVSQWIRDLGLTQVS